MPSSLRGWLSDKRVIWDAPMREHTWFRIGGCAEALFFPASEDEISKAIALCLRDHLPYFVMGNGSNLLVRDGGISGLTICTSAMNAVSVDGNIVYAQCGAVLAAVSKAAADAGIGDMTWASGIPGSVGGAVYMNAGAYGGEIAQVCVSARVLRGGKVVKLSHDALNFGYRHSALVGTHDVVLSAKFALTPMDPDTIVALTHKHTTARREKQPLNHPSAGSAFKRPPSDYAARLIEQAGLKGASVGGAEVSTLHAGFIINTGGATASDVLKLMAHVQETVFGQFGVTLEPEVLIVGEDQPIRKCIL